MASFVANHSDKIKLPNLPVADLEKLDLLLSCLKENKEKFIDINIISKEKWGGNRLLYLFFAEYLKNNSFTLVENYAKGQEYVWKQMIAPRGLAFGSFKKEYLKQQKMKKLTEKPSRQEKRYAELSRIALLISPIIIFFLCSIYLFNTMDSTRIIQQSKAATHTLIRPDNSNILQGNKKNNIVMANIENLSSKHIGN